MYFTSVILQNLKHHKVKSEFLQYVTFKCIYWIFEKFFHEFNFIENYIIRIIS